jgi:hypothetical protein
MTSYLDKLNLRPQERRLVVFVAIVVFVVINIIWVVPQFGKVAFWDRKRQDAEGKVQKYNQEIGKVKGYTAELTALQNEGITIGDDDPTLTLQQTVSAMAGAHGVAIELNSGIQRSENTNSIFQEAGTRITTTAMESNLVEFLYAIGSRGTLIRVRTMSLQPDPTQVRLKGTLEFVQSFLKKPSAAKPGTPLALAGKPGASGPAKAPAKAGATNSVAGKSATAATKPAENPGWFKKLISRITGGSSAPKQAATTNTAAKPSSKQTFTPKTNKPPVAPAPTASK